MKFRWARRTIYVLCGWLVFLSVFSLASLWVADSLLLPSPPVILARMFSLPATEDFASHYFATLGESLISTSLALAIGGPLGIVLGRMPKGKAVFESPVDWMRSIPATALFPVMMLFFGLGSATRIAIAVYAATFAVAIPTMFGASGVDEDRLQFLRRSGFGRASRLRHAILWEAMPSILAGLRLAISSSLVLIVVGEMFIGANAGLGFMAMRFQERYQTSSMYATIVLIGITGYALNRLVRLLEAAVPKGD